MTKPTGRPRGRPRKQPLPDGTMPPPKPRKLATKVISVPELAKNVGGRGNKAHIDLKSLKGAAGIGCTLEEMAAVIGVSPTTLNERMKLEPEIGEAIRRGQAEGRATIRRFQWQGAAKGNAAMCIWLGKQLLGQRDIQDYRPLTPEEIRRLADAARSEAANRGFDEETPGRPDPGTRPH
jgi:hypothetical protein